MKYTAGELAKKLGVSARTIRWYDEKNLLAPCAYSEAGYRLYDDQSAERLQKIMMLRYMDFSLEQIREMTQGEDFDVRKSLDDQERLLQEKKEHIERVLEAVRRTQSAPDSELWENMLKIIEITREREYVIAQYRRDDNLNKRISIHDYSTAKEPFYTWMQQKLCLEPGMKILDIGCGNAAFWRSVAPRLPEGLEIHLVDYSAGMLDSAKNAVEEIGDACPDKKLRFVLDIRDAAKFSYPVKDFDRIMANHMLYHINRESRFDLYRRIGELLSASGRFSCSLIGRRHLEEMHELVRKYYPDIKIPSSSFDIWLETAREELSGFFDVLEVEEHENDLLVPEAEMVLDYVASYSAQAKEIVAEDRERFLALVRERMTADGCMYIHKSTGLAVCGPLCQ